MLGASLTVSQYLARTSAEFAGIETPAIERLAADSFTLGVTGPGPVTVHIHDSPHWAVDGQGCTTANGDGWIELHDLGIAAVQAYLEQVWGAASLRFKLLADNREAPHDEQ